MTILLITYFLIGAVFYFFVEGFELVWKNKIIFDLKDHNFIYFIVCIFGWLILILMGIVVGLLGGKIEDDTDEQ
jgi:hypothetical protein